MTGIIIGKRIIEGFFRLILREVLAELPGRTDDVARLEWTGSIGSGEISGFNHIIRAETVLFFGDGADDSVLFLTNRAKLKYLIKYSPYPLYEREQPGFRCSAVQS